MTEHSISYQTLRKVVVEIDAVPAVLARSTWPKMNGSRFLGVMHALRTLGLIEGNEPRPSAAWETVLAAGAESDRARELAKIVEAKFMPAWRLASEGGSPRELSLVLDPKVVGSADLDGWAKFVIGAWRDANRAASPVRRVRHRRKGRLDDMSEVLEARRERDWADFWRRLATDESLSEEERRQYRALCEDMTRRELKLDRSSA